MASNVIPFPERQPEPEPAAPPAEPADLRTALGEVLRDERQRQERTLADVADGAAVSLPYLSEVERGRKDVSADLLTAISTALGLDVPTVLERTARRLRVGVQRGARFQLLAA